MAPKKFVKKSTALVKRVKALEVKQKADDKTTERKKQYYYVPALLNNIWGSNGNFILRTGQGIEAEGNGTIAGRTRIGNSVNLRSSSIKFHISLPRNTDGNLSSIGMATVCRIMLVDNLTDNTSLLHSDILQTPSYPITSSYKNSIASGKRYKVLMDKTFTVNTDKPDKVFSFKLKVPKTGRVVHYNGNLDTNPSDFNVSLLYYCSDIAPLSTNQPLMRYYVKSVFEDA